MNCVIIEDQPPAQRILKKYISDYGKLELLEIFSDPIVALDYLKEKEVDLIFLDIHLPKLSGMDFLRVLNKKPLFILTTAFHQYAVESYEFNVLDYLLKPISYERFLKSMEKLEQINNQKSKTEKSILVKVGYDYISIKLSDILYIQSDGDYTKIITPDKSYLANHPLKHWKDNLSQTLFCQIHRSFLININKIEKISSSSLFINKKEIPIGRKYKPELKKYMSL